MAALNYGIRIVTQRPFTFLQDWLDGNCRCGWDIRLDNVDERSKKKVYTVIFAAEDDRNKFKLACASGFERLDMGLGATRSAMRDGQRRTALGR